MEIEIGLVVSVVFAFVALTILGVELRARRKLLEREFQLQKDKLESERLERTGWDSWLETQRATLFEQTSQIGATLASSLAHDPSWAILALERAKLGPYAGTLFGVRRDHFSLEKEYLAEKFGPLLFHRIKHFTDQGRKTHIVIDSGTTLFPWFRVLAEAAVKANHNADSWIHNFKPTIITNNLPGVQTLMDVGRPHRYLRYGSLAVNCSLLPGSPLPIYSAVTGPETNAALIRLREEAQANGDIFIGLVTGNWIQIAEQRNGKMSPIPLARGEGHKSFKETLIECCDETFVIASLGKLFAGLDINGINEVLGFSKDSGELENMPYEAVSIKDTSQAINLVTTTREPGMILHELGVHIRGSLGGIEESYGKEYLEEPLGQTPNAFFRFDDIPKDDNLQRKYEFPHLYTRDDKFIRHFSHPSRKPRLEMP